MSKTLGITALVLALVGILVPLVTIYLVWLTVLMAGLAGLLGNRSLPLPSLVVCLVNLLFLSPLTLAALKGESLQGGSALLRTTQVLFVLGFIGAAAAFRSRKTERSAEARESAREP